MVTTVISNETKVQLHENHFRMTAFICYLRKIQIYPLELGSDTSVGISGNMSQDSGNSKETAGKNNTTVDVQCGNQADDINGQNVRSDDVVNQQKNPQEAYQDTFQETQLFKTKQFKIPRLKPSMQCCS